MHPFAGGNTGTLRSRRAQPQQNHNFEHMSESEDEGDSDDEVLPQRGGGAGGGLRQGSNAQAGAAAVAAPLDAAAVVADIKHAVMESLRLSYRREKELMDETYGPLTHSILELGEALKFAGAPIEAIVDAAEKLIAVQRGSVARVAALQVEAENYDPSRFVGGGNGGENGETGAAGAAAAAAAAAAGGAGDATDFAAKLAGDAGGRRRRRRRGGANNEENDNDDDDDSRASFGDSAAAAAGEAPMRYAASASLAEIRDQEDRLNELRGFAPEQQQQQQRRRRGEDDEVMEVRGAAAAAGAGRPAATAGGAGAAGGVGGAGGGAGGHQQALLGGARNARCPLTSRPLAQIEDPVEDSHGFVYERAAIEGYILSETGRRVGGRRAGLIPPPGSAVSEYPADVVERATSGGVVAPFAGTNFSVSLGSLKPARRLLRELAARRARVAAGGGGGGGGGGEEMGGGGTRAGTGAGADADIEISE